MLRLDADARGGLLPAVVLAEKEKSAPGEGRFSEARVAGASGPSYRTSGFHSSGSCRYATGAAGLEDGKRGPRSTSGDAALDAVHGTLCLIVSGTPMPVATLEH